MHEGSHGHKEARERAKEEVMKRIRQEDRVLMAIKKRENATSVGQSKTLEEPGEDAVDVYPLMSKVKVGSKVFFWELRFGESLYHGQKVGF